MNLPSHFEAQEHHSNNILVHGWIDPVEGEGGLGWNWAKGIMSAVPALMLVSNIFENLKPEIPSLKSNLWLE